MLKLEKIHKSFEIGTVNEKHILKGVNLEVNDGDFITIIGGNGAGKSTLLNSVAGTFPVTSGKIFIDGDDVTAEPEFKRVEFFRTQEWVQPLICLLNKTLLLPTDEAKSVLSVGVLQKEKEVFTENFYLSLT